MKKLFLSLIVAGFMFAATSVQAQNLNKTNPVKNKTVYVQLSEQLNQLTVNISQVADILDVHTNNAVDTKNAELTRNLSELQKNLEKAAFKLNKIKADRNLHSTPEDNSEDDLLDTV